MRIVWFKRDLRVHDHAALVEAAVRGSVIPVYIFEPDLWAQPDMARRHFDFLSETIHELDMALRDLGAPLVIRVGDAVSVLEELRARHAVTDSASRSVSCISGCARAACARRCRSRNLKWLSSFSWNILV